MLSAVTRNARPLLHAAAGMGAGATVATAATTRDRFERVSTRSVTNAANGNDRTALQKHVDFFDGNGDGSISLGETQDGLMKLGLSYWRAVPFSFFINGALGQITGAPWWSPFTIDTSKIHLGKHASDTDIYDEQGNFNAAKFEELFQRFDLDGDDALSETELENFFVRNKEDEEGSFGSQAEFRLLMELAGETMTRNGQTYTGLSRARLAEFYDGSLFYSLAGERAPF